MSTERAYVKEPQFGEFGPGWWDVQELLQKFELEWALDITIKMDLMVTRTKQKGLQLTVTVDGREVTHLGSGFGKAYPDGPKTAPAAIYNLLYRLYDWWDGQTPLERAIWLASDEKKSWSKPRPSEGAQEI